MHQQQTAFENIVGKGEIVCKEQLLFFPQCFLLNQIIVSPFVHIFDIISLFAAEFEKPKIGISGKGLKVSLVLCTICRSSRWILSKLTISKTISSDKRNESWHDKY